MSEQEEFFSPKQNKLLNIATWAKYLAWVALIFFILTAISSYFRFINSIGQPFNGYTDLFRIDLGMALNILFEPISTMLKGAIYFVVLKGLSLGLNMIVETDINYREKLNGEATNER